MTATQSREPRLMNIDDVRARAFAMPLNDPAYPKPPYRFYDREYVVITYRTDPAILREVVPEPLEPNRRHRRLRVHPHAGFHRLRRLYRDRPGDPGPLHHAAGEVEEGGYVHAMYLDDNSPIAGGREIWGFPKKLATPRLCHEQETLVGTLHYGSILTVNATMGYKHVELPLDPLRVALAKPAFMIKIIPHVDCTPRICELVRYHLQDVTLKGAWSGPAALQLFEHAMCDVARLPVREVVGASHYIADLTLGLGEVVFDYLA